MDTKDLMLLLLVAGGVAASVYFYQKQMMVPMAVPGVPGVPKVPSRLKKPSTMTALQSARMKALAARKKFFIYGGKCYGTDTMTKVGAGFCPALLLE